MSAVSDNPAIGSQIAPPGNQTQGDPSFEKRVLALQNKERELQKKEAAMKDMMSWDQVRDLAKKDRKAFAEKLGIDLGAPEPVDPIKQELSELRARIEADQKAKEKAAFKDEMLSKLNGSDDKFELIKLTEQQDDLIEFLYNQRGEDGSPLDFDEVASAFENSIMQKAEAIKKAKKLSDWFAKSEGKPTDPQGQPQKTNHPLDIQNTLNSNHRGNSNEQTEQRPLSRHEALLQAAAHIKYKD